MLPMEYDARYTMLRGKNDRCEIVGGKRERRIAGKHAVRLLIGAKLTLYAHGLQYRIGHRI